MDLDIGWLTAKGMIRVWDHIKRISRIAKHGNVPGD